MANLPTIKKGSSGAYVERMQHLLAAAGIMARPMPPTMTVWGSGTEDAKKRFDNDHGLTPSPPTDCGDKSWESLIATPTEPVHAGRYVLLCLVGAPLERASQEGSRYWFQRRSAAGNPARRGIFVPAPKHTMKGKRDEVAYQQARRELKRLKKGRLQKLAILS